MFTFSGLLKTKQNNKYIIWEYDILCTIICKLQWYWYWAVWLLSAYVNGSWLLKFFSIISNPYKGFTFWKKKVNLNSLIKCCFILYCCPKTLPFLCYLYRLVYTYVILLFLSTLPRRWCYQERICRTWCLNEKERCRKSTFLISEERYLGTYWDKKLDLDMLRFRWW